MSRILASFSLSSQVCRINLQPWRDLPFLTVFGPKHSRLFPAYFCTETKRTKGEKLSYFSLHGEEPLRSDTIGNLVDIAADKFGTKDAVVVCHQNIRKNFIEFKQDVDKFAAGLIAIGLEKGDRIGIWSPNNYEWLLTQYASAKAGLILVNINLALQTRELEYCLKKVGIRAVVSAETFRTKNYYEMFKELIPSLSTNVPGRIVNDNPELKNFTHLIMITNQDHGGAYKMKDVMATADNFHYQQLEDLQNKIDFDNTANIQFTSGTTGFPKGVKLTHHNVVNNAHLLGRRMRYYEKTHRICMSVPLFHCFGCVMGSLAAIQFGACQVYPSPTFNAKASVNAIQTEKCTSLYGTPTMFIDMLNLPDFEKYDFSSVSTGIMAGAPCPENVVKNCVVKMNAKNFVVAYGTTEISPIITQNYPDDSIERRTTTIGCVLPHSEIKVIDSNGSIVPCGSPGELCARGYMVMMGYWDDTAKTAECITPDRWYKTGDLAVVDEHGYVKIIGRIKDMIIRGGENIYPKEIEEILHAHPKIVEAQVVGIPNERLGEEVCAWINLKSGEKLTVDEVKSYCKEKMAHFKIPRYVMFVESFPKTVSGKIQKYMIRDKVMKDLGLK